jgi:hypothetical protein
VVKTKTRTANRRRPVESYLGEDGTAYLLCKGPPEPIAVLADGTPYAPADVLRMFRVPDWQALAKPLVTHGRTYQAFIPAQRVIDLCHERERADPTWPTSWLAPGMTNQQALEAFTALAGL